MDQINRALTAVAGVLSLVYLFGMGAMALRLTLNHLPLESVVTQLTQPYLLVVGLEVVLPVALVAVICSVMIWLYGKAPFETGDEDKQVKRREALRALGATLFLVAVLVVFYELAVAPAIITDLQAAAWVVQGVGPLALALVIAGIGAALIVGVNVTHKPPYRRTVTLTAISVVAGTALLVWGGLSGIQQLNFVKVCSAAAGGGRTSATTGTLVASSGGEVQVAHYPPGAKVGSRGTLEDISSSDVAALYVGTDQAQTYGPQSQCPG